MFKLTRVPLLLLALTLTRCDEGAGEDAERLAGWWIVSELSDDTGTFDVYPVLPLLGMTEPGTYELEAAHPVRFADIFRGAWQLTGIRDQQGIQTEAFFEMIDTFNLVFEEDGMYELFVDYKPGDPRSDVRRRAPFGVDDRAKHLALAIPQPASSITLSTSFQFESGRRVHLAVVGGSDVTLLNSILGTSLQGSVVMAFDRTDAANPSLDPELIRLRGAVEVDERDRRLTFSGALPGGPLPVRYALEGPDTLQIDVSPREVQRINGAFSTSFVGTLEITFHRF